MRMLARNKQTIGYALYQSKLDRLDEYGNKTGEQELTYSTPATMKVYVTAAKGEASLEMFGVDTNYSKIIYTENMDCPIDEHSRIWIDKPISGPHDYAVTQVARSLNHIAYAVKEVSVR